MFLGLKKLFKAQSGRSMIEMLGVLAIIGVLSVGGIAGYSRAMFKYKMNQTIQIVTQAMQRLIEISDKDWGNHGEINADVKQYINLGLLPAELCPEDYVDLWWENTGKACKLPLGEIWLEFTQRDKKPIGTFHITFFEGDIKESCVTFLSHGWQDLYPQEWLMNAGNDDLNGSFIHVTSRGEDKYLWAERPDIYTGAKKDNITLDDIENACSNCEGKAWCGIWIAINSEL